MLCFEFVVLQGMVLILIWILLSMRSACVGSSYDPKHNRPFFPWKSTLKVCHPLSYSFLNLQTYCAFWMGKRTPSYLFTSSSHFTSSWTEISFVCLKGGWWLRMVWYSLSFGKDYQMRWLWRYLVIILDAVHIVLSAWFL